MKADRSSKEAFTLVELLVVISIIALLLAILMPSLSKARRLAKRITCGSQLHQMGIGSQIYASDNDDKIPSGFVGYGAGTVMRCDIWTDYTPNLVYHLRYDVDLPAEIFYCPSYKNITDNNREPCMAENFDEYLANDALTYMSYWERVEDYGPTKNEPWNPAGFYTQIFKMSELGSKSLISDLPIADFAWSAHPRSNISNHSDIVIDGGWNVVYGDGSVFFKRMAIADELLGIPLWPAQPLYWEYMDSKK